MARASPSSITTASPGSRLQIKVTMQSSHTSVPRWAHVSQSMTSGSLMTPLYIAAVTVPGEGPMPGSAFERGDQLRGVHEIGPEPLGPFPDATI